MLTMLKDVARSEANVEQTHPAKFLLDFEDGMIGAVRESFPSADVRARYKVQDDEAYPSPSHFWPDAAKRGASDDIVPARLQTGPRRK